MREPMQATSESIATRRPRLLSRDECIRVLDRTRFGHLTFVHRGHVEAVPIRFVSVEGWLYYRATAALRDAISSNPWVGVIVSESDGFQATSVVARGGCYPTERTGSPDSDARALRGIMQLRDDVRRGVVRTDRADRASIVFRMFLEELRGRRLRLPDRGLGEPLDPGQNAVRRPFSGPSSERLDVGATSAGSPTSHSGA